METYEYVIIICIIIAVIILLAKITLSILTKVFLYGFLVGGSIFLIFYFLSDDLWIWIFPHWEEYTLLYKILIIYIIGEIMYIGAILLIKALKGTEYLWGKNNVEKSKCKDTSGKWNKKEGKCNY